MLEEFHFLVPSIPWPLSSGGTSGMKVLVVGSGGREQKETQTKTDQGQHSHTDKRGLEIEMVFKDATD